MFYTQILLYTTASLGRTSKSVIIIATHLILTYCSCMGFIQSNVKII